MSEFSFSDALLDWFDQHGRHDLPWQVADDPYKVWVSEIMLQQTQVKTVLQYFDRFMARFPTVADLGTATWEDVAPYWAGLGYYARARNLHKAAAIVKQNGQFPETLEQWIALPGIGRSTAGALMSLGLRQYGVIMDGNVKRVLSRFFAIEDDLSKPIHERELWALAENLCPVERNHDYTQAIMDLGATICTPKKPLCLYCPMQQHCKAHQQGIENELPFKKAKKPVPVRTADVILIRSNAQWLWQQRDSQGLWGGLWCLPILDNSAAIQAMIQQFDLKQIAETLQISHSFTHFTWLLNVQTFHVEQDQMEYIMTELRGQWLTPLEATERGIPTAMKKLIAAVDS
ncbi:MULTISPECIES: A/G-specific adenine glycosylase [Acinetobacter]|uniref:Adenine DNA glycosylase n=1 Tax=Acinetobacter baylyi (strain ATCC 33305 / BD413 / ADP1) TaxID=62977 RepID=Q6F6S4_ACIAD|nr:MULTISPECIES: A/G-specific adenine glycosylase [Acinetobacter]ENV55220.1 A/G-specific adenine glycosylase [Acinetobacter baylyi DSM 14961 = CIP 107474]KAF2370936.1 A/G-specific adenine glycosylase [Acinetobacter baylyi]KAF2374854.1 A/G-specific adenine glycosylase [Acinetobacter baylyi]KAF2378949.1 A/G-specific adenine glycosylase [Acinetobacter baylyi]KAF2381988.1 A/G-specific adenine glycosylase [Acinetobacter baylyi]